MGALRASVQRDSCGVKKQYRMIPHYSLCLCNAHGSAVLNCTFPLDILLSMSCRLSALGCDIRKQHHYKTCRFSHQYCVNVTVWTTTTDYKWLKIFRDNQHFVEFKSNCIVTGLLNRLLMLPYMYVTCNIHTYHCSNYFWVFPVHVFPPWQPDTCSAAMVFTLISWPVMEWIKLTVPLLIPSFRGSRTGPLLSIIISWTLKMVPLVRGISVSLKIGIRSKNTRAGLVEIRTGWCVGLSINCFQTCLGPAQLWRICNTWRELSFHSYLLLLRPRACWKHAKHKS